VGKVREEGYWCCRLINKSEVWTAKAVGTLRPAGTVGFDADLVDFEADGDFKRTVEVDWTQPW
jgi:hypothetical protein